jgi:hypothetical protein
VKQIDAYGKFEILMAVTTKVTVFWDVTPCSLVDFYQVLSLLDATTAIGPPAILVIAPFSCTSNNVLHLAYYSFLKMEAARSSKLSQCNDLPNYVTSKLRI